MRQICDPHAGVVEGGINLILHSVGDPSHITSNYKLCKLEREGRNISNGLKVELLHKNHMN